jgi:hypothetical protein
MILLPIHRSPCPVLLAVVSQLFTTSDLLRFVTAKIFFERLKHTAPYQSCVRNVPALFTYLIIRYENFWCGFDRASSLICGNKMPTRCNRWFLLQILLFAQHVSGTIMPIIRSSRVLYKWFPPANRTHNPQLHIIPTTWKPKHQISQAATTCIILSSSWWWA